MRKVLLGLGILILVFLVGVGIFAATFDVNRYHDRIQALLGQQLNRGVTLGDMNLGFFPLRFRVQNLAIADDAKFNDSRPFVQAQELDVAVKLMPLLQKSVEIDSITLARPSVELIKDRNGMWNFASLGNSSQSASTPSSATPPLALSQLVVQDGQVAMTDLQEGSPRSVYDHIDVTLKNFAPNQPFSLDVAAHLPGAGAQEIQLQGDGGPIAQNQPAATPFHGTLTFKQVTIAGFQQFIDSPALANTDGVLSGETKIASESGKLSASGQITADSLKVHGTELGYPIAADYDISDDVAASLLTISNTTIKLGSTPLGVSGTVNSSGAAPKLDLNLKATNVSIAEAVKLAAASGIAFAPGIAVTGNVSADIKASGTPDQLALNGTVNGSNIEASGKELARPVQVKAVNLTLTPTEIHSDNFNVTSGGTAVAVQFALRQYLAKSPLVDATVRATNAGLPEILSMAKAYGVTSLNNVTGEGTLSLNLRAAGPMQSVASNEVTKALNGTVNLNFSNVKYAGSDMNHELSSIAGFVKPSNSSQSGMTDISKLTGNIVIKNGLAQTSDLQAALSIGNVSATGTANLVDQTLNMRANAVLSKDSSQQAGGTGVGGYMQTALANNQGELVIPVIITGTFQQPKFTPDMKQVAQMKLKGLLPSLSNPAGGVSGILGGLIGQKSGSQTGTQGQQQNQNPVQSIMGLFGKKKQ